jgi:hypothetical protein
MQIAASMYLSPPSSVAGSPSPQVPRLELPERAPEGMVWLQRRENELEQELHGLLDAQSDALMAGIGGQPSDDLSSIATPNPLPENHPLSSPPRKSIIDATDLISVRRSIYKTVRELTAVKSEEEALVKRSLKSTESTLQRLDFWDQKKTGLQKEIETIQHQDIEAKTQSLQTEADKLQEEITETEQKLNRMRQRHAHLLEQISQIENSVQSRLSSYVTSLNILEDEIQQWLARPPSPSAHPRSRSPKQADFYTLSANRRTLDIARNHWKDQRTSLDRQRKTIRREKRALEQGALVWKEVVTEITSFERLLQKEMTSLKPNGMQRLLAKMDDVIVVVEEKLETATQKNWNLLIACIGAELEAFRQGRNILQQAAGQPLDSPETRNEDMLGSEYESSRSHVDIKSPSKHSTKPSRVVSPLEDDSDDGPDPQLLVAKGHLDSE